MEGDIGGKGAGVGYDDVSNGLGAMGEGRFQGGVVGGVGYGWVRAVGEKNLVGG